MHKNIIQYKYKKICFVLKIKNNKHKLWIAGTSRKNVASPKPALSHVCVDNSDMDLYSDEIEEKDKDNFMEVQPDALRNSVSLIIVKWVQCDKCEHLMFCTDVRFVRTGSEFVCVHCKWVLYVLLYCYHSVIINKGNNKITEPRTILQRESQNS